MTIFPRLLVDAGIEKVHLRYCDADGRVLRERAAVHRGDLAAILAPERAAWSVPQETGCTGPELYLTGKLSAEAARILGGGTRLLPEAVLFRAASALLREPEEAPRSGQVAIIDFSASGYLVVAAGRDGAERRLSLVKHPACGAGSGVNLRRILDKLAIGVAEVDGLLAPYLGDEAAGRRAALPVRTERCGVFSVSATVSDKNQGIPIAHALAVTMKSEAAKPCSRVPEGVRYVYLTGGCFRWQFMRDCAADLLRSQGIAEIRYDEDETLLFQGLEAFIQEEAAAAGKPAAGPPRARVSAAPLPDSLPAATCASSSAGPPRLWSGLPTASPTRQEDSPASSPAALQRQAPSLPPFRELRDRLTSAGRFLRLPDEGLPSLREGRLSERPVWIALDMGSSMAKLVIADAVSRDTLYRGSLPNRGDALQTLRHFLAALQAEGIDGLTVQQWGLTGSGRYQIGQVLAAVYPHLRGRILTLVENEAHVLGSLAHAERHVESLKRQGHAEIRTDVALLVDIGGEDTKLSVVSLAEGALVENAMNCKCSAGTGSLMDVLKDLLSVPDVARAYGLALEAPGARPIAATCAVFLMEAARKLQAGGVEAGEILASCCWAIVENMARTLWRQVNCLPHTVVLLHGQTMLSDPLALATIDRLETHCGGPVYGLIPPHPGHRACDGLIGRMPPLPPIDTRCDWERFSAWRYERTLFQCKGLVCGNEKLRCTRTVLSSQGAGQPPLTVTIGGCATVNEPKEKRGGRQEVPDAYRELWQWLEGCHPRSQDPDRLVIPRCFSLTREAYPLAILLERLGIAVHCDPVREEDIRLGAPCFTLDTCAPNLGAAGQCLRLAAEPHGLILLPQIDFLPAQGASLGRACTTNQGGIWAAVQFARQAHPGARFLVAPVNLGEQDFGSLTRQFHRSLGEVFASYGVAVDLARFRSLWQEAQEARAALDETKAELTACYLEGVAGQKTPVAVVCGREYVLNPGVFDQHVSKLLKDKGILPLPSYAFDIPLDPRFAHLYWKSAHEVVSKAAAVVERRLHEGIRHPRLRAVLERLEKGEPVSRLSHAVVTTFHCGPDSVTAPLLQEWSKRAPSLWIQSDGALAELAHLENRISTHLRRLERGVQASPPLAGCELRIEELAAFNLDGLDRTTDVVYFPTMADNRFLTALVRAMGFTAADNYADEGYDLEEKGRRGRRYVGDAVCQPLAAVFADMVAAVEDFAARRTRGEPAFRGKRRIVLFMHGGDGPCRLGQYIQVFKLAFWRLFGGAELPAAAEDPLPAGEIRLLENVSTSLTDKNDLSGAFSAWAGILGYQALVVHGLCQGLLLEAAARCRDEADFRALWADYGQLKEGLIARIARGNPGKGTEALVRLVVQRLPRLKGAAQYLGYGLYRNFGLRPLFRRFRRRWLVGDGRPPGAPRIRIHLDGEVYMRACQAEGILKRTTAYLGYGSFAMTLTPTWCFMESVLYNRLLSAKNLWADLEAERRTAVGGAAGELAAAQESQARLAAEAARTIAHLRDLLARPLYEAAGVAMPHGMKDVNEAARPLIPTGKPYGELVPFVGEAILKAREGADLILNVAPEGCMVSGMGDMLIPSILTESGREGKTAVVSLCSRDGEIREEELRLALLKALGERWAGVLPASAP